MRLRITMERKSCGHERIKDSYVIQLAEETARFSTYEIWHQALGHPSTSVLNRASSSYDDAHLIPKNPRQLPLRCVLTVKKHTPQNQKREQAKPSGLLS